MGGGYSLVLTPSRLSPPPPLEALYKNLKLAVEVLLEGLCGGGHVTSDGGASR